MKPPNILLCSSILYQDAKRTLPIASGVDALTISKRNKRNIDEMITIRSMFSHAITPSSKIFFRRIWNNLEKGKQICYNYFGLGIAGGLLVCHSHLPHRSLSPSMWLFYSNDNCRKNLMKALQLCSNQTTSHFLLSRAFLQPGRILFQDPILWVIWSC